MSKLQHNMNKTLLVELQVLTRSFFSQFKLIAGAPFYIISPVEVIKGQKVGKKGKINNQLTDKGIIYVPYFVANKETNPLLTEHKLKILGLSIIQTLGLKECEVRYIRLEYPYLDNFVLAHYLAYNGSKYNFTQLQKSVLNKVNLISRPLTPLWSEKEPKLLPPTLITGIKFEVAGRLTTQRSVPRKTVENTHSGSFRVNSKLGSSLDYSQYASKNKLGVFSVKIGSSQKTLT